MKWIHDARGKDDYEVYCPYELDYMKDIFGKKLKTPKNGDNSVIAKL
jgi:hypothetical protein